MTADPSNADGAPPLLPTAVGAGGSPEGEAAATSSFSILFAGEADQDSKEAPPDYFGDLNIDQMIDGIVAGRDEYNLRSLFNTPLRRVEAILYRNEVFNDCRQPTIRSSLLHFAEQMRMVRQRTTQANKLSVKRQRQAWLLDSIELYCSACMDLHGALCAARATSLGLTTFLRYLDGYLASPGFSSMRADASRIKSDLESLRYKVLVEGGRFTVQRCDQEIDYSQDVLDTFARFKQGDVKDHHSGKFHDWPEMNHIEAKILEFVALLFPEPFSTLEAFCDRHRGFEDPTIRRFDREVQFYHGYLDYIRELGDLPFANPKMSERGHDIHCWEGFDLPLAVKLAKNGEQVVRNSFALSGKERILVVTGPNQGGKTTFARMFGQVHYLAAMGCPVPGKSAHLRLFDALFTHFEREESIATLSGKLQDDLTRIKYILDRASSNSIVILNEIFTSTSLADALFLSKRIVDVILAHNMLAVWVTFVDELSRLGPETVSMVSEVADGDPAQRTFRILRRVADGRSHAMSLAKKHGLTCERVIERVRP